MAEEIKAPVEETIEEEIETIERKNYLKMDKEELKEYAEELCVEYNSAYQMAKYDIATEVGDIMEQVVNRFTSLVSDEYYKGLASAEDPMISACLNPEFTTIRISDKKEMETKIPIRGIAPSVRRIDIMELYKRVPGGIGRNPDWIYLIEKLNLMMTLRVAKDIGSKQTPEEIKNSWSMSDMARKVRLGEVSLSNTNMLKVLNTIVKAMIGEKYSAFSHDVRHLELVYTKESNKDRHTVVCASNKDMRWHLVSICNRILTNGRWDVESKEMKKKK